MKIKFLGTGANGGLPQLDCRCGNCRKAIKDNSEVRLRSSLLIETKERKFVLDCGPDFRQQLLEQDLKLQDIDLIVVTHLHFDHVGGLMELSGGRPFGVPVLVSKKNKEELMMKGEFKFLIKAGFMRLVSEAEGRRMGVELFEVPHDPNFPTSAIIVNDGKNKIWYSPDAKEITKEMVEKMEKMNLVIFDATFLNEDIFPARKFNHTTIEKSAAKLVGVSKRVIFSHINHSEDSVKVRKFLDKFNFELAKDSMKIII